MCDVIHRRVTTIYSIISLLNPKVYKINKFVEMYTLCPIDVRLTNKSNEYFQTSNRAVGLKV